MVGSLASFVLNTPDGLLYAFLNDAIGLHRLVYIVEGYIATLLHLPGIEPPCLADTAAKQIPLHGVAEK